jgi:ferredoxin/flavodoxin
MKSVIVYYFSGTGNTELVTNMIMEEFSKHDYNVDIIRIEDILKENLKIALEKYDLVGIGAPVFGYGAPNIIHDFIPLLPKESGKKVFIFRTAGGVAPINYNASKPIIRKLAKRGYEVFHERVFSIGSNWIVRFDDIIMKQLYEATSRKVAIMCRQVINGERRILNTGLGLKILMELVMPLSSWVLRLTGKDMVVNNSCSHCGLCIKNCPMANIYEKNGKIRFKLSCNSCLRCVYSCPKGAISFRFLSFFPVPGGYNVKKILENPCDGNELLQKKIPPFFNGYIQNDAL